MLTIFMATYLNMIKTCSMIIATIILLVASCKLNDDASVSKNNVKPTTEVTDQEWQILFDGTTTEGWRAYNGTELPPQWVIKNDELTFDKEKKTDVEHEGGKDIIYAAEEFDNFELYLEWKIPEGGNSGIFYHVKEGYSGPPVVSPEYQLIDDENYAKIHDLTQYNTSVGFDNPSELHPLQSTGADYAMYAPDASKKKLNPTGEWNNTTIVYTPNRVEHWLNGQMLLSFDPTSEDWQTKRNSGKWESAPDYAKFKSGYIGLQDHDSPLWFRNIKIKKL